MNGEVKGETEEGNDDEVDQSDRHCGGCDRRVEGPEVEHGEADGGVEGLGDALEGCARDTAVGEDLGGPLAAEQGGDFRLEHVQVGEDVVGVGSFVAGGLVYDLARAQGIEGGIAELDGLAEEGRGVGVDDDGGPRFPVVHGAPDGQGVVVEGRWGNGNEAEMRLAVRGNDGLGCLRDHGPDQRRGLSLEVDDVDDEGVEVIPHVEEDAPVQGEDREDESG